MKTPRLASRMKMMSSVCIGMEKLFWKASGVQRRWSYILLPPVIKALAKMRNLK